MGLKKYFNYYEATFKGEIQEKLKRKIEIKLRVLKRRTSKKIPKNLAIKEIFLKILEEDNLKSNINIEQEFYIFNKKLNLEEEFLDDNKNSKEWFLEKIGTYKDIKVTWEINRLQFLNYLVQIDKNERAIDLLDKWIEKNPYNIGINWNSNLEVAIRSISILNFIFKTRDKKLIEKYKETLYLHGKHIYEDITYTEKCIPNNHVIGEAVALYCLGRILSFEENNKWIEKSKIILKKYIEHFHQDGTYEEASLSYHRFTLQMYIMFYIFSIKSEDSFLKKELEKVFFNSIKFFNSIEKPNGEFPDFGDNDEGLYFLLLNNRNFSKFVRSLDDFFKEKAEIYGELQELKQLYKVDIKINRLSEKNKEFFEVGKYYCYKNEKNYIFTHNQNQIFHSHSDGMSIELVLDGKNVLIDSGTYNYNVDKQKRSHYRGTRAHNTVWLGENQSIMVGSFRWVNKLKQTFELEEDDENKVIKGSIELKNKKHIRTIKLKNNFSEIRIEDEILNTEKVEINWIFSNEVVLEKLDKNRYKINPINYIFEILNTDKLKIELQDNLYSQKYNEEIQGKKIVAISLTNKKNIKVETFIRKV